MIAPNDEAKAKESLDMLIDEMDLTVRSYNCLKRAGIDTVGELVSRTEDDMRKIRNFGAKSLEEIKEKISTMGLKFTSTMESSKASISAIGRHRFDIDGKGIRTLIVFSGCPLRCKYCINPYTWDGTKTSCKYSVDELITAPFYTCRGNRLDFLGKVW